MRIFQRNLKQTTGTFLYISHTTNVLLFKFRCNILIGVRISKEMPGSVASVTHCTIRRGGRDSSVGIANRYGLDGPGIEYRRGRDFPQSSRLALGPTQLPIQWVTGPFPGGKAAGAWR